MDGLRLIGGGKLGGVRGGIFGNRLDIGGGRYIFVSVASRLELALG